MRRGRSAKVVAALGLLLALVVGVALAPGAVRAAGQARTQTQTRAHAATRMGVAPSTGVSSVLPPTTDGIHRAQIVFDCNAQVTPGLVEVVWNYYLCPPPSPPVGSPPPPPGFFYVPFDRQLSGYGLTKPEIEAQHPDWIVYTCPNGQIPPRNDSAYFAWEFGDQNQLPLDITNPAVLNYMVSNEVNYGLNNGWNGISFDNVTLYNNWQRCGVYRPSVLPNTYQWHWLYGSGPCPGTCAAFKSDTLGWEQYMFHYIHVTQTVNPAALMTINWSVPFPTVNGTTDPGNCQQAGSPCQQDLSDYESLLPYTDLIFDEMGFSNFGRLSCGTNICPNDSPCPSATIPCNYLLDHYWDAEALALLDAQTTPNSANNPIALMYNCYEPQTAANVTPDERQWCAGNYLLFKAGFSYAGIVPANSTGGGFDINTYTDYPELEVAIGAPTTSLSSQDIGTPNDDGVYLRQFTQGDVLVNPSSSATYTVPVDWTTYKSIYCNAPPPTGSSATLGPHSALMLITQQTPCVN